MSRDQIISDALKAISDGQAKVLSDAVSVAVDESAQEQKASDGTLTQADVDAAVAKAVADVQAVDAQALSEAHAAADAQLADLKNKLDDMTSKKLAEEGVINGLQSAVAAMKVSIDAISALLPAPQP